MLCLFHIYRGRTWQFGSPYVRKSICKCVRKLICFFLYCGVRVSGVGWFGVHVAGLGLGDFRLAHPCACTLRAFFIRTHSQRETWVRSTPHGFAYCESSSERWVGSPMGQYLSSRPPSVVPGIARLFSHQLVSAGLRVPRLRLTPSATTWCFPI